MNPSLLNHPEDRLVGKQSTAERNGKLPWENLLPRQSWIEGDMNVDVSLCKISYNDAIYDDIVFGSIYAIF